jgi:hypothetical protein
LDELGITIDDEFIKICIDNNFKSKYLTNHVLSQEEIQNLFLKFTKLSDIKKIIGNNKVTFDVTCLRNACSIKNNRLVIKYLLKKNIVPDFECLRIVITNNYHPTISPVFNSFLEKK